MASRKGGNRGGSRGSSSLLGRAVRRVLVTLLAVLIAAAIWTAWIYFRTPRQDRNLRAAAGAALDRAEDLYAKVPHDAGPLRKLPDMVRGDGKSADPNAEIGKLDQPFLIARVLRVVDGDTLVVENAGKEERVRLLMVNTPESVHPDARKNVPFGKTVSEFTHNRLDGRQVRLHFEPGHEQRDRYGRLLCYVFVGERNFNLDLVTEGMSPYYTEYGHSQEFDKEFREAEKTAQERKKGIWGDPDLAHQYRELKKKWASLPVEWARLAPAA